LIRTHATGWERNLNLQLPVYELSTWRKSGVVSTLIDSLQYLTGDRWKITFVKRRKKCDFEGQLPLLNDSNREGVFLPFSNGLDSYAQTEIFRSSDPFVDINPIRVTGGINERSLKSIGQAGKRRVTPIEVTTSGYEPTHTEPSFRSRAFIFDLLSAYGATLTGCREIVIPENRQGSIGSSLIRLGGEAPHRSCHPGFTSRLRLFVQELTGKEVEFVHPALYQTKGQVLAMLYKIKPESSIWLQEHPSCSYDARQSNRNHRLVHCGVCGNCLLRRMSLYAAGIVDVTEYKVMHLDASTIQTGVAQNDILRCPKAFEDLAGNSVRGMQRLALLASNQNSSRVLSEVEGLARYQNRSQTDTRADLARLLDQHCQEWTTFLAYCGKASWLAQLAQE
jgi:7-cyano-7-deazaguanine synthase in queuosine biosynthesis